MTPRGSFGKPLWFEHKINSKDDIEMIMLIGQMGLEGYGIHWILQEFLASQNGYRAHISTIPALASRYETTSAKVEAVIRGYGLYALEKEDGDIFFSPQLSLSLNNFDQKCLEQKEKAEIGAKKKKIQQLKIVDSLNKQLSEHDSTMPRQDNGDAYNNTTENSSINEIDKNELSNDKKEQINFQTFRERLLLICPNFSFSLQNKLGYSAEHSGFCLKNGYIYDVHNQRLLDKNESFEIWDYLFKMKDKVFELVALQNQD